MSGTIAKPPQQSKYDRLIAAARSGQPALTVVAHPCDETSLRGAIEAAEQGLIVPILVGPEAKIRDVAKNTDLDLGQIEIVDAPHSHAAAAEGRRTRTRRQGRTPDEGEPPYRRADAGGRRIRYGAENRTPHQPRLRHGRAASPRDAVHHRRGNQYFSRPRRQAGHRPERDRSLDRRRPRHAARGDPLRGRDRHHEDPVDDRSGRALQDGRARADHRRTARRSAGLRQRHRSGGGTHQGHYLARRGPRPDPRRARPRGRQHAGEEPDVPRKSRRGRHRARRPRTDRADLARRIRCAPALPHAPSHRSMRPLAGGRPRLPWSEPWTRSSSSTPARRA